jgi:hypothetical protein
MTTLTNRDPEPPAGSVVIACGVTWKRDEDGGAACWSSPGGEVETWTKIAGNYGPVIVACYACGSVDDVTFDPDPYADEICGDDTPVWECASCRIQSSDDV